MATTESDDPGPAPAMDRADQPRARGKATPAAALFALATCALLAGPVPPARAQSHGARSPEPAAASAVGDWLHDTRGDIIGSVKAVTDGGRTAVIALGIYFRDHVRLVRVPAEAISIEGGRAVLRPEVLQAVGKPPGRG